MDFWELLGVEQPSHTGQEESEVLQQKQEVEVIASFGAEQFLHPPGAGESSSAGETISHSALGVMQEPPSHTGRGEQRKAIIHSLTWMNPV